jgi:cytoskeleton protein RodZ
VLTADQDSWADIRDARQMKLLYETVPAGRTVTLEGVAPLSVFLGNAAGVRLDYNGRAVDVARHKRGMMARFTLGEEEASVAPAKP